MKILFCRKTGKDAALLRAIANAKASDAMRRPVDHLASVHHDGAAAPSHQAKDGLQRRCAPRTVAAEQCDEFSPVHGEVHAVQDVRLAIEGVQVL